MPARAAAARALKRPNAPSIGPLTTDTGSLNVVDEFAGAGLDVLSSDSPPEEVIGPSGRVYRSTSLLCLRPHHQPRQSAIRLVEWRIFDPLILATILANCATLAWESPVDPPGTAKAAFIDACENVYLGIFTIELLLKVVAYGFLFHDGAYLHDAWCQLDFVVVTLAWVPIFFPTFTNFSAIRSVRALRPLRALKRVPGMPVLIRSIIDALPRLITVAALCGFVLFVFGIVGVEFYKGALHYHCTDGTDGEAREDAANVLLVADDLCDPTAPEAAQCGEGRRCLYYAAGPMAGTMGFDNMGMAMVALLQALTADAYDEVMHALMATTSAFAFVYFILVIIICGFFIINLFLAVMFDEFLNAKANQKSVDSAMLRATGSSGGGGGSGPDSSAVADAAPLVVPGAALSDGGRAAGVVVPGSPGSPGAREEEEAPPPDSFLGRLVHAEWFSRLAMFLVLLNMALMCMPYADMSEAYNARLELAANAISALFIAEMALKHAALGVRGYWSDQWNAIDGVIVSLSMVEVLLSLLAASGGINLSFLRALRLLRVLRILRLMRSWKGLYRVLSSFLKAMPQLFNMFVLMFLTMLIFSLMGMQFFGGQYDESIGYSRAPCPAGRCEDAALEPLPRFHFDYFGPAMITTFVLLTGKWSDALAPAARAVGPIAAIFFGVAVLVGIYLIMNLFVAILLNSFAEESEKEEGDDPASNPSSPVPAAKGEQSAISPAGRRASSRPGLNDVAADPASWRDSFLCIGPDSPLRDRCDALLSSSWFDRFIVIVIIGSSISLAFDSPRVDPQSGLALALRVCDYTSLVVFTFELLVKSTAHGFLLGERPYCSSGWNLLDLSIVVMSYLALLAELFVQFAWLRPLRILRVLRPIRLVARNSGMRLIIDSLFKSLPDVSNVLGVVLTFQMVFAILGMQMFMGSLSRCSDPSLLTRDACHGPPAALAPPTDALAPDVAALRMLLAEAAAPLPPRSLAAAVPPPPVWRNPDLPGSFDDFKSVMLLLYVMSTADDWDIVMYHTMDATEPGKAPLRDNNWAASLFSICWMFVGCFFAMNLFVGVIVDNFNRIKKKLMQQSEKGTATMTADQQMWSLMMASTLETFKKKQQASRAPHNAMRKCVYDLVHTSLFEGLITVVITLNILLMACDYYGIEDDVEVLATYNSAMALFVHIYYVECVLKIIGMGQFYFLDRWCQLDFALVVLALIDEFAAVLLTFIMNGDGSTQLLRMLRVVRILRVLRLLKGAVELKKLILTLLLCIAPLVNVAAVLMLTVFIYAVLGVNFFTFVAHQEMINDALNFDDVSRAALLLFQCLTGDGWGMIMMEASVQEDSGKCVASAGNCGSRLAVPYFVSFQVIGAFVFLNLVVAVMLESFTELGQEPDHTDEIIEVWKQLTLEPRVRAYVRALKVAGHADARLRNIEELTRERLQGAHSWDVRAALKVLGIEVAQVAPELLNDADFGPDVWTARTSVLRELILRIAPPLGLKGMVASYSDANKLCFKLRLTQVNGRVSFKEVLQQLLKARLTAGATGDSALDEDHETGLAAPPDGVDGAMSDTATSFALGTIAQCLRERRQRKAGFSRLSEAPRKPVSRMIRAAQPKPAHIKGVPEHQWKKATQKTSLFFPVAPYKKSWDVIVMFLILYSVIIVPYRVGFEATAEGFMWYFEVGVTLIFLTDLFATFNSAYLEGDRWVISREKIAMTYLKGWFWIDLPASLPIELILLAVDDSGSCGDHCANIGNLKMLRALRMVRMLRLLKLFKLDEYVAALETELKINLKVLKIAKMISMLLFIMHLLGCFWFYIAQIGGYEVTWLTEYDGGSGLDAPVGVQYLYSVYWALMTLTTVGYGDITPVNDLERAYALASLLIGAVVFGYILSSVGSMISNLDNRATMVEMKLDMCQEVIRHTNMPSSLAARVRSYTEYYYSHQSVYDVEEVLAHLTPSLDREVKQFFLSMSIDRVPFLRVYGEAFKLEVMARCRPMMSEAQEVLLHKGSRSDELLFLQGGEIKATAVDGSELFSIQDAGHFFGAHVLLGRPCPMSYVCSTRIEMLIISCDAVIELVQAHLTPSQQAHLTEAVVRDICKTMRLRCLSICVELQELKDANRPGTKRLMAALTLQAGQIRRLTRPAAFEGKAMFDKVVRKPTPRDSNGASQANSPSDGASSDAASGASAPVAAFQKPALPVAILEPTSTSSRAGTSRSGRGLLSQRGASSPSDVTKGMAEIREKVANVEAAMRAQSTHVRQLRDDATQQSRALNGRLDRMEEALRYLSSLKGSEKLSA